MKHFGLYLSGPLVVALLVPLAFGPVGIKLYPMLLVGSIPVVLTFSLLVAAPLFLVAARKLPIRASVFIGLAFIAGFLSFLAFACFSAPDYSSAGEIVYVRNGHFTIAGWKEALVQSAAIGLASIPGGVLWWLAARTPLESSSHGA